MEHRRDDLDNSNNYSILNVTTKLIINIRNILLTIYTYILSYIGLIEYNNSVPTVYRYSASNGRAKRDFIWNENVSKCMLGHGTFGSVLKLKKHNDQNDYAVKIMRYDSNKLHQMQKYIKEVQRLAAIGPHLNIMRYFDCWVEDYAENLPYADIENDEDEVSKSETKNKENKSNSSNEEPVDDDDFMFTSNYKENKESSTKDSTGEDEGILILIYHQSLEKWYTTPNTKIKPKHRESFEIDCLKQLSSAMAHCHTCNIIHGDLNPANIFVAKWDKNSQTLLLVIGDFGLSNGTLQYMSPEQNKVFKCVNEQKRIKKGPPKDKIKLKELEMKLKQNITTATDVFTMGMVFAEFIMRIERCVDLWEDLNAQEHVDFTEYYPERASKELRKILVKMTMQDPLERCTFEDVLSQLNTVKCTQ